jgi:hypothetical protein
MSANRLRTRLPLALVTSTIAILGGASGAQAAPVKLVLASHFGREVNLSQVNAKAGPALEDVCTVESKDTCQPGKESSIPGGFSSPAGVAGAPNGNVYVADENNNRVQEFTADGHFILMFGKEVNQTTKANVCTQQEITTEGVKCQAGKRGEGAGEFIEPRALAIDGSTGSVYVSEPTVNDRVDEFTSTGQFVLMIGKEVNQTTKANLCTAQEVKTKGVKCKAGVFAGLGITEHGAFVLPAAIAVGPEKHLLYVGDEHRVQEFDAEGKWVGEPISKRLAELSSAPHSDVKVLAVDAKDDAYLVYADGPSNVIRVFDSSGQETATMVVKPREENAPGVELEVGPIAVDSAGDLAVTEREGYGERSTEVKKAFGSFHNAGTGLVTSFPLPGTSTPHAIAFNGDNELYAAESILGHEVLAYRPLPVGEPVTEGHTCSPGGEKESDVTLNCTIEGAVNPWGVSETEAWFEWGRTSKLGNIVPLPPIKVPTGEAPVNINAEVEGVRPNESSFYYRVAAYDHNVKAPELPLAGDILSFTTPIVPPKIVGEPKAEFVTSSSAVLSGELNPEHAKTEYFFEYAPYVQGDGKSEEALSSCPGGKSAKCDKVGTTAAMESGAYGKVGTTLEAKELQPNTHYHYRLMAENEDTQKTKKYQTTGPEGAFTTGPSPVPQAATGAPSAVAATSATVSGTVNPDGQRATYAFELGVYAGGPTQYGIVFSGPAGTGTVPVTETLGLTGLQPGTTYAYRIKVASGYGTQTGEPVLFTTEGLPSVLISPTVLAQLPVPNIAFPTPVPPRITRVLTNAQKLAKALKACKKRSKKQRAACRKQARKQYTKSKQADNRKKG